MGGLSQLLALMSGSLIVLGRLVAVIPGSIRVILMFSVDVLPA